MFSPSSSIPFCSATADRRNANYHPTIWGEHFLSDYYAKISFTGEEIEEHARVKEEIRKRLQIEITEKSWRKLLDLIDTIQRLGFSYHFQTEIESSLLNIYNNGVSYDESNDEDDNINDLYTVSLRFRLLRQHGHYISCDVFNKFKDSKGKFKELIVKDVKGMLSLYEASNYRIQGENILEEALLFTTSQLEYILKELSGSLAAQVKRALNFPIQKTLTRLGGRHFISLYQEDETHNDLLLTFAKLDFNILQKLHQKELNEISKWWKELDCAINYPFARDRLVECYFWILAMHFEPQYELARRFTTKIISITSILDDIYDVYGTIDELLLLTDAIERWDINAVNKLPEYMRLFYKFFLSVYSEMEEELAKSGNSDRVNYAKQEMKKSVRAYLQEALWFNKNYVPKMDEYMKVSLVSCGYLMLATTSVVGMGDLATKEVFDWMKNEPFIVRAASVICRLMDDMVSHQREQEIGHVASAVECYMKEHGASEEEACIEFEKEVTNAWKDMNKEFLNQNAIPMPILETVMNLARFSYLLYKHEDGYTNSTTYTKQQIASLLIHPIT
ncbi:hypothetical protein M9H77_00273 [Catharanthus roseus]|nr:hypothetical protein M9H77_00273 [Catharanthus roseus]